MVSRTIIQPTLPPARMNLLSSFAMLAPFQAPPARSPIGIASFLSQ
jgi:hypothetical protein